VKIHLSTRQSDCSDKEEVEITSGNIIEDTSFLNYDWQYHKDYLRYSKVYHKDNLVNIRFKIYRMSRKNPDDHIMKYSYLNRLQRFRLRWMTKTTWLHRNSNGRWLAGLIIAFILGYILKKYML
jgi:hypothetical protein